MDMTLEIAFLTVAVIAGIIGFTAYKYWWKDIYELPLSDEVDEGNWAVPLGSLGRLNEGRVTTARRTVQGKMSRMITASTQAEQKDLITYRDTLLSYHLFAQRVRGKKVLYLFEGNPLDPRFFLPGEKGQEMRWIGPVQECRDYGHTSEGFDVIYAKLDEDTKAITTIESSTSAQIAEAVKIMELAAAGKEYQKKLEDRVGIVQTLLDKANERLNKLTGEKGESDIISSTTPLIGPPVQPQHFGILPSMKQFFTWTQLALALIAFLLTPNIMQAAGIVYPDKSTVAIGVAIAVFFVAPFIRKALGK
jgi:hypothetical protein